MWPTGSRTVGKWVLVKRSITALDLGPMSVFLAIGLALRRKFTTGAVQAFSPSTVKKIASSAKTEFCQVVETRMYISRFMQDALSWMHTFFASIVWSRVYPTPTQHVILSSSQSHLLRVMYLPERSGAQWSGATGLKGRMPHNARATAISGRNSLYAIC